MMPRPLNEDKLLAQEAKTLGQIEATRLKRELEDKQLARQLKKSKAQRITTLGQICHDLFPEHATKDIAKLLRTATWHEDSSAAWLPLNGLPDDTLKQHGKEKRGKVQKAVANGVPEPETVEVASHLVLEEVVE